jgi:hypothetical protein
MDIKASDTIKDNVWFVVSLILVTLAFWLGL